MTKQAGPPTNLPRAPEAGAAPGGRRYWRSLEALASDPAALSAALRRAGSDLRDLVVSPVDRRSFLGMVSASMALAGVSLTGCVRKPREHIVPYTSRPEDLIPGRPRYFATSAYIGGSVIGLLAESQDGRPTKVEGNPQHPGSLGGTSAWAQASVLSLYSPARSRKPTRRGKGGAAEETTWADADGFVSKQLATLAPSGGQGLAVLFDGTPSPTLLALLEKLQRRFPQAQVYTHEAASPGNARAGAALVGAGGLRAIPALDEADIIVAVDCDLLGTEGDTVRNARRFADGRRLVEPTSRMNRLYAIEPLFTVTGAAADHRLQLPASEVGGFLAAVAGEMTRAGFGLPEGAEAVAAKLKAATTPHKKWARALAKDLIAHGGRSLICVGERQPAWVHGLGHLINAALGNIGRTVTYQADPVAAFPGVAELARAIKVGQVKTLLLLGTNPAYDAPGDLGFADLLAKVPVTIHHGIERDETGALCTWHLPASHYLESWGDLAAADGTVSLQQPLVAPLFGTRSTIELVARFAGAPAWEGHKLVRGHWAAARPMPGFDATWRRWLHDGVVAGGGRQPSKPAFAWGKLAAAVGSTRPAGELELVFAVDPSVYDGRFADNAWLQEMPDPITKLTWDNAALMGPATARKLGVTSGDVIELAAGGKKVTIAAFVTPGVARGCVALPLGYGRKAGGPVADGVGFDAYPLRSSGSPGFVGGATARKTGARYDLASTQDYGSLTPTTHEISGMVPKGQGYEPRPMVREATLDEYRKDPRFPAKEDEIPPEKIKSLFVEPHVWKQAKDPKDIPQQWGMSIDLTSCIGCNACLVGCQAENNISVVGKERVLMGREMHWIRIDRYYAGEDEDAPEVVTQPVPCQQCENAPCETVCPVNATSHSPEGLNDMAYNRCIGTRYCSNNCPPKVRRFNYFNFSKENDALMSMIELQRNPDVTVRFRGVMEKCTYCVQRINQARIDTKVATGSDRVPDGTITPACAQACPTRAIVFGDISDEQSAVARAKARPHDYAMLAELNIKPRTTYLGKVRNPNPELA